MKNEFDRRTVMKSIGVGTLAAGLSAADPSLTHAAEGEVPFSTGVQPAQVKAPPNACDCHIHIYDGRLPSTPSQATVKDYAFLQKRIGTSRTVIVNPSAYAYNNEATVTALEQLGSSARGIAVINTSVTDAELKRLHEKGVRGIRVTRVPPTPWDDVKILSKRVADLGWHIQFNINVSDLVANEEILKNLPTLLVVEHLGRVADENDPALKVILRMIDRDKAWVKLSGAYLIEPDGAPKYPKAVAVAKIFVKAAPERAVWGSDWPHPSARIKPDDAQVFDLSLEWAPTESQREAVFSRNPELLYGFGNTTPAGMKK